MNEHDEPTGPGGVADGGPAAHRGAGTSPSHAGSGTSSATGSAADDEDTRLDAVDVLVVGGGPVGVATALLCARRGLRCQVLERSAAIYDLPRAIVFDDEIQRVFQNAGLTDGLAAITTPLPGAEFVDAAGTRIVGFDLPVDAPWPLGHHPVVAYDQPELEAFLRAAAIDAGVPLVLGVEVTGIEPSDDHVDARTADGTAHRGRWLVAADGASSPIRKQLGVAFVDQGFDQEWLVVDTALLRPVPALPTHVQQICDPVRPVTFVPGHDSYRRWELQLQPGESREHMTDPERVWELLSPWITPDDAVLRRAVVYRFHATVAATMRVGRVLLAGDAAHQMPPFLGQGLCSGVRDAANLAWKLALVEAGVAGDALIDTYDVERRPHAAGVVAHAADTGRLIDELAGRASGDTGIDAAYGGGRPFPFIEAGLVHGDHLLVGRQLPQPRVDGRLLDELLGDGFALVVADDSVASTVADRWAPLGARVVVVAPDLFGDLPGTGALVVRPDRTVAAVAGSADELAAATRALLTTASARD